MPTKPPTFSTRGKSSVTETTVSTVKPDHLAPPPGSHLQVALGWRDILENQFVLNGTGQHHLDPASLLCGCPQQAGNPIEYRISVTTQRSALPGELIALRATRGPGLIGFIAKAARLPDGWMLAVDLVSQGYGLLKARTQDIAWPDGHREITDVIDIHPPHLPRGQRSLLIKATRTCRLVLSLPRAIELDGSRWVRASQHRHTGHLVVTTWFSAD